MKFYTYYEGLSLFAVMVIICGIPENKGMEQFIIASTV